MMNRVMQDKYGLKVLKIGESKDFFYDDPKIEDFTALERNAHNYKRYGKYRFSTERQNDRLKITRRPLDWKPEKKEKRDMLVIGYGIAMADFMRSLHACEVTVRDLCQGVGYDLAKFKAAGLPEYDLKDLRKALS